MTATSLLGIVGSTIILLSLFEMMRRHRLREKYALIWAVVAILVLLVAALPVLLESASSALGIQVPANLLFFGASILILVLTLHHSSELGRLEERTRTLAEEVALLRLLVEGRGTSTGPADAGQHEDSGREGLRGDAADPHPDDAHGMNP